MLTHSNVQSMFNCALYSDETSVCRLLHRIDYKGIVSYFHIRHNAKTMESSRFRFLKMLNFYLEYFRCMLVGHYYNYVRFWMDDFIRNCYIAIFQFLYRIPRRCWNSWEYANNPSYVSNSVVTSQPRWSQLWTTQYENNTQQQQLYFYNLFVLSSTF